MAGPPPRRRTRRQPPQREAGDPPDTPVSVSAHALDVLLKLEAEHLVPLLPARFGVALAPIRRQLPTELPQLDLHLERLDRVFELEDRTILDLEFESELSVEDLRRFVVYGMGLGPRRSGEGVPPLARLRATPVRGYPENGGAWGPEDRLDLALLPLMRHAAGTGTAAVVREGLELAQALPEGERARPMGALLALAYHYEGEAVLGGLLEELMNTTVLDEIFAEKLEQRYAQGIKQGVQQGSAGEARRLLRRYLGQRFGSIPPALDGRIAASGAAELDALFDHALVADTIDAL